MPKYLIALDNNEQALGYLPNAKNVEVRERLNGEALLSFEIPFDVADAEHIELEGFIKHDGQLYVIKEVEQSDSGRRTLVIRAVHVYIELLDDYIDRTVELFGVTAQQALTEALQGTDFVIGTVDTTDLHDIELTERSSLKSVQEIREKWAVDLWFDNRTVYLGKRGHDDVEEIRYGKNLKSLRQPSSTKDVITRLFPYGKDGLTIEGINNGVKYIDSVNIGNYSKPKSAEKRWNDIDDPNELYEAAERYLSENDSPKVSYQGNFIELDKMGLDSKKIGIGDSVSITHTPLGVDVNTRVIDYTYYPYESKLGSVTLSNSIETEIDDTVKFKRQQRRFERYSTDRFIDFQNTTTNFNNRNDRISTTPAEPTIKTDQTAIDHTVNTDGSVDISFEWQFNGTGNAYNIDGFIIYVYSSDNSTIYDIGTAPSLEQVFYTNVDKRAFLLYGIPSNRYYTFGVQAYRRVDSDINTDGILKSGIVKSLITGENPYQPKNNVEFNGNVLGTVNGKSASSVSNTVTNFNNRNDRLSATPATPSIAGDGSAVDHTVNSDGSADISFEWGFSGSTDSYDIDGFIVYVRQSTSSSAYTFGANPSQETVFYSSPSKRSFIMYGVPANRYYTFGVQAYRIVDKDVNNNGILLSSIATPYASNEDPYRPSSSIAFGGDITGTVAGVPADSVNKTPVSFIIADADTSQDIKRADYVVPNGATNAQDTINQAINALPSTGGKIVLLDGTFDVNSTINLPSNVVIEGQGQSTVVKASNFSEPGTGNDNCVFNINNKSRSVLRDLRITCGPNSSTAKPHGLSVLSSSNIKLDNVTVDRCDSGVNVENSNNITVRNCDISTNGFRGVYFSSVKVATVTESFVENNEFGGIDVYGNNITVVNCFSNNNGKSGISITGGNGVISNNNLKNNGEYGVSSNNLSKAKISNNEIEGNNLEGLRLTTINESNIFGNTLSNNGTEGIKIYTGSDNNVINNTLIGNGTRTDNTYSNIQIIYNSDKNNVQSNTCRLGNNTNRPKFGIEVKTSDCNDNVITNNDLKNSGASGSLSDAGTGTVTTAGNRS